MRRSAPLAGAVVAQAGRWESGADRCLHAHTGISKLFYSKVAMSGQQGAVRCCNNTSETHSSTWRPACVEWSRIRVRRASTAKALCDLQVHAAHFLQQPFIHTYACTHTPGSPREHVLDVPSRPACLAAIVRFASVPVDTALVSASAPVSGHVSRSEQVTDNDKAVTSAACGSEPACRAATCGP